MYVQIGMDEAARGCIGRRGKGSGGGAIGGICACAALGIVSGENCAEGISSAAGAAVGTGAGGVPID